MKIICSKNEFLKGLNIVNKAVPTKSSMTILECILVDATSDEIKLTANDMEIGIETIVDGVIEEPGIVAIDAKKLVDIIRKISADEIIISTDDKFKTEISFDTKQRFISGRSGEDFSNIPFISRNEPIEISQLTLKDTIKQTIFSISDNDKNKVMTGELFEITGDKLRVVSIDGQRLSIRNVNLNASYSDKKVIVPGKTLNEIIKIIPGEPDENVKIFITDNHIIFEFDKTVVVSRLIEGEFFKIDKILSTDYKTKININRNELFETIDSASVIENENNKKPIVMTIDDRKMNINIVSIGAELNDNIDIVKEGVDIKIGFNPKFFNDALRVINDENINIYMVSPKAPCFIKDDDENYMYVIFPVYINN